MGRARIACCVLLVSAAAAHAGIVVELSPSMAPPNANGTYNGGERFQVDVILTSDSSIDIRLLQFDHTASSPELVLGKDIDNGLPVYEPTVDHPFDGVGNFLFNYGSLSDPSVYSDFSNLQAGPNGRPWPASTVFTNLGGRGVTDMLSLEAGVPFLAGAMQVTLPSAADTYLLDLLNEGATDRNLGLLVMFGGLDGSLTTTWGSADDGNIEITYAPGSGPAAFAVVPEPISLVLLAAGGLGLLVRRESGVRGCLR